MIHLGCETHPSLIHMSSSSDSSIVHLLFIFHHDPSHHLCVFISSSLSSSLSYEHVHHPSCFHVHLYLHLYSPLHIPISVSLSPTTSLLLSLHLLLHLHLCLPLHLCVTLGPGCSSTGEHPPFSSLVPFLAVLLRLLPLLRLFPCFCRLSPTERLGPALGGQPVGQSQQGVRSDF